MTSYGDPEEIEKEIDDALNPDLHDDTGKTSGDHLWLGRVLIRSFRALPEFDRAVIKARILGKFSVDTTDKIQ